LFFSLIFFVLIEKLFDIGAAPGVATTTGSARKSKSSRKKSSSSLPAPAAPHPLSSVLCLAHDATSRRVVAGLEVCFLL